MTAVRAAPRACGCGKRELGAAVQHAVSVPTKWTDRRPPAVTQDQAAGRRHVIVWEAAGSFCRSPELQSTRENGDYLPIKPQRRRRYYGHGLYDDVR